MHIFARTMLEAHVDHQLHAEVAQSVVIARRRRRANEEVRGDGGEVQRKYDFTAMKGKLDLTARLQYCIIRT